MPAYDDEWYRAQGLAPPDRTPADNIEHRAIAEEVRAEGEFLTGYAIRWGTTAKLPNFEERILPGAFSEKLATLMTIPALVDHDRGKLLGRYTGQRGQNERAQQSLGLAEDDVGLSFAIRLPGTSLARDIHALAKDGLLGGVSIGFVVPEGGEQFEGRLRTLSKVDLREISIITGGEPAYPDTSVAARSRAAAQRRSLAQRRVDLLDLEAGE